MHSQKSSHVLLGGNACLFHWKTTWAGQQHACRMSLITKKRSAHLRATSSFPCSRFLNFSLHSHQMHCDIFEIHFVPFVSSVRDTPIPGYSHVSAQEQEPRNQQPWAGARGLVVIINNNQFPVSKMFPIAPQHFHISIFPFFQLGPMQLQVFRIWWENWNKIWQHNARGP